MATKLGLYNAALRHIGERKLSSLTEASEPRRTLDDAYENFVDYVLAVGYWKCAQRVTKLTYDPGVTVEFGYPKAYAKPTDFIRMYRLSEDEYFNTPLLEYSEEAGYWYSWSDEIYLSYISNDATYGGDLTAWPPAMAIYAEFLLATRIVERLAPAVDSSTLFNKMKIALDDALAKDAMEGPTEFPPMGGWVNSRGRRNNRARERGSRSTLIG